MRRTIWVVSAAGTHTEWEVPQQTIDGLKLEYPTLNIGNELKRMHLWSLRNASKRWSEAGVMRGIVRWLNRAREAKAKVLAEKQGRVVFGPPPIPKAYEPGKPPSEEVRAVLDRFRLGAKHG